MFTGLIENIAAVKNITRERSLINFTFSGKNIGEGVKKGDSVAINGVCLTAVDSGRDSLVMQAVPETLKITTLKELKVGDKVNLECSMKLGDRVGGHLVNGHVDGIGKIVNLKKEYGNFILQIQTSQDIIANLIEKGSVAVDGVSLTIQGLTRDGFWVAIIPHTLARTTLHEKKIGDLVNIEVDQIAKYVKKFTEKRQEARLTQKFLKDEGF